MFACSTQRLRFCPANCTWHRSREARKASPTSGYPFNALVPRQYYPGSNSATYGKSCYFFSGTEPPPPLPPPPCESTTLPHRSPHPGASSHVVRCRHRKGDACRVCSEPPLLWERFTVADDGKLAIVARRQAPPTAFPLLKGGSRIEVLHCPSFRHSPYVPWERDIARNRRLPAPAGHLYAVGHPSGPSRRLNAGEPTHTFPFL